MKKLLVVLGGALLLGSTSLLAQAPVQVQTSADQQVKTKRPEKCGFHKMYEARIAHDPAFAEKFKAQKAAMQAMADNYIARKESGELDRTTATISAVPVIFHIAVDSAQFNAMGGTTGIAKRCDSQIAVLNRDYNHENADSTAIPSSWKALYSTPGIKFGLARIDPDGNCSPGYEIRIIPGTNLTNGGFADVYPYYGYYDSAKTSEKGLASWDNTKYYNVWCINYTDDDGLLGITTPLSFTDASSLRDVGVCILYSTLGCTAANGTAPSGTGSWPYPYNLGRTLTHETGHFFEIWHPWGDDGPGTQYNGYCPWSGVTACDASDISAGYDDGLSDTPPESQAVYGNPTYTITGGTYNDCCQMHGTTNTQPIGIACLSYMDYTDDDAMHMFTTQQAAAMASMVLVPSSAATGADGSGTVGENYNLTQNPSLLVPCGTTVSAVPATSIDNSLNIFPNPTTGEITITLNASASALNSIIIVNLLGQEVISISGQTNKDFYSLDLSGMSKGIYFIKCNFASGSITRKVLLQ